MTDENDIETELSEIVYRFCGPQSGGMWGPSTVVLDRAKPNIHESKSEFLAEKQAVAAALEDAKRLLGFLTGSMNKELEKSISEMLRRVTGSVNRGARKRLKEIKVKSAADLVRKNAGEVGFILSAAYIIVDLQFELSLRKRELEDQERDFWSGSSRPPNHYARTMALRLARIVARETGRLPTLGVARDGNHPSTDYGRALEDVFKVLGIKASFRRAGKWAIEQLTDEDTKRPLNALAGLGVGEKWPSTQSTDALVALLSEGKVK